MRRVRAEEQPLTTDVTSLQGPGVKSHPWTEMLGASAAARGLDLEAMLALIPAGHMAETKDHAHLVAYFASEEAGHVTGQVVSVDGGQSLYMPLMAPRQTGQANKP